ncbi:hypothetical protein AWB67_06725 [Caballeronia terrestris]|jgi:hypothetical protein|uniref:Uncharacterized protein n=1 Tax=Caballeronia terrestris TaxID=1226301 RepID=A0A158KU06_9BURK|nr:hypothetical protein AWB67_06725 [Caballeronia terrestris]
MLWLLGCVIGRASRLPERKPRGDSVLRINAILKAMRWPHLLIEMTNRSGQPPPTLCHRNGAAGRKVDYRLFSALNAI